MGDMESPASRVSAADSIESLADYLLKIAERTDAPEPLRQPFWFRGQADAAWDLQPTILRKWFLDTVRAGCVFPEKTFDAGLAGFEMDLNWTAPL